VPLNDYRVVAFMLAPGLQPGRINVPGRSSKTAGSFSTVFCSLFVASAPMRRNYALSVANKVVIKDLRE